MLRSSLSLAFSVVAACSPDIDLGSGGQGGSSTASQTVASATTASSTTTSVSTSTATAVSSTSTTSSSSASGGCNGGASGTMTSGAGGDSGFELPKGNNGTGFADFPTSFAASSNGSILVSSDYQDNALFYAVGHDTNLALLWRREYGLGAVDMNGDLVAAGAPNGDFAVIGSSPADVVLDCATLAAGQAFVAVLDPNGAVLLARSFQTNSSSGGSSALTGVVFTSTGDVVIGGTFSGDFDYGGGTLHSDTYAAFVLRMDTHGTVAWAEPLDGAFEPHLVIGHNDEVYVATSRSPTSGAASDGIEVDAFDASGSSLLHHTFDGAGARVEDIDLASEIVIAGSYTASLDLGAAGALETPKPATFLTTVDSLSGDGIWAVTRGTTGHVRFTIDNSSNVTLANTTTNGLEIERLDFITGETIKQMQYGSGGQDVLSLVESDSTFLVCGAVSDGIEVAGGFADTFTF